MNKSMLYAGLMSILSTTIYAENNTQFPDNVAMAIQASAKPSLETTSNQATDTFQQGQMLASQTVAPKTTEVPVPAPQDPQIPNPQGPEIPTPTPTPQGTQPSSTPNAQLPATQTQTSTTQGTTTTTTQSTTNPQPATQSVQTPTVTQPLTPPQPIDCNYHIPPTTTDIDQGLIMKWAEKATAQSFDFDYTTMDTQLAALKACYTDLGWQGFNDALQKSGNLNAIKSQQLMVSSMVNGTGQIAEIKDNQWKISLPLQVVYQNNKEKLTQSLTINLIVGRKVSGDLGIMQMIAIPRTATNPAVPVQTTPPSAASPSTTPAQQQ